MTTITQAVRDFLAPGPLGHVVTLEPDGTPHVSLAWVGVDGDGVVFATFPDQHKLRNLRRDPRVTLSFEIKENPGEFLHPYMVLRGRARLIEGGALEVMDRLAETFIGPGATFPMRNAPPGFVVHVDVERVYGMGAWRKASDSGG